MEFKADVDDHGRVRIVRLVGRLQREHLPELTGLCDESPLPVRLDLADLVSVDAEGLEALLVFQSRGAKVAGASRFVALQLERAQRHPPSAERQPGPSGPAGKAPRR